jgi:uncharacterized protein
MSTTPERPDPADPADPPLPPTEQSWSPEPPTASESPTWQPTGAPPSPAAPGGDVAPPSPPGTSGDYGPPGPYASAPAYGVQGVAPAMLTPQEEKGWSLGAHLLCLVGGFVAPLIIWLVFKGRGPFLEHHAKEALNFQITVAIALVASFVLMFLLVGFVLILVLLPWMLIMPILAAVKANNGEWFRYPLTLRLVK